MSCSNRTAAPLPAKSGPLTAQRAAGGRELPGPLGDQRTDRRAKAHQLVPVAAYGPRRARQPGARCGLRRRRCRRSRGVGDRPCGGSLGTGLGLGGLPGAGLLPLGLPGPRSGCRLPVKGWWARVINGRRFPGCSAD
ncbi:hypothetical protein SSCG_03560 [Streptomyces clavuligerus]|nr:hypothetical protein SSCG_03560 [Streptomyces clavuligerus]